MENYRINTMTTKELLELRKKLAKKLNQRMVRLEKKGYTKVGAYIDYKKLLKTYFNKSNRIPENLKNDSYIGLPKTQIKAILKILNEQSSTVSGWNKKIKASMNTINEKYSIKFSSPEEMVSFFESRMFQELTKYFGSAQAMILVNKKLDEMPQSVTEVIKSFEDFKNKTDRTRADTLAKDFGFDNDADMLRYIRNQNKK